MANFKTWITAVVQEDRAASIVEYALLLVLIAVIAIAAIGVVGGEVNSAFDRTGSGF